MNKAMVTLQKIGVVAGPVRVLTVTGRKTGCRAAPRQPRSYSMTACMWSADIQVRTGCATLARPAAEPLPGDARSNRWSSPNSPQPRRFPCWPRFRTKFLGASASSSAPAWCGKERPKSLPHWPGSAPSSGSTPPRRTSPIHEPRRRHRGAGFGRCRPRSARKSAQRVSLPARNILD